MEDITTALAALEKLSSSPSTSASGPLNALLEQQFAVARDRITAGSDPKQVIQELLTSVARSKKEVEKGLKGWYAALGNVGKAVEKTFPPSLAAISDAYANPPLFAELAAKEAMDKVIMDYLGRRGLWDAVSALEEESAHTYEPEKRALCEELFRVLSRIEAGDLEPAIRWCKENSAFLSSPPHPSSLPYELHRAVFLSLSPPGTALTYARQHLMAYVPTQPVLQLITSCLYPSTDSSLPVTAETTKTNSSVSNGNGMSRSDSTADTGEDSAMEDVNSPSNPSATAPAAPIQPYTALRHPAPLARMFEAEFCRRHGLPKEDLLSVAVDLGTKGGALAAIEKARKVMLLGDRLGNVREWDELPMEIPLPSDKRFHSVFVCPVSKEQATDTNPPLMLSCGHVINTESFQRLVKGGRRTAKCPYCPIETAATVAQRLYF